MERRVRVLHDRRSVQGVPSTLERLAQGSTARARVIEAAKQAELASKANPIADLTSGEITKRKLRKLGIVAGGTAGLVTLVAAVACKGGGEGQEITNTPDVPTNTPVATKTAEPSRTPTETIVPTPTEAVLPSKDEIDEIKNEITLLVVRGFDGLAIPPGVINPLEYTQRDSIVAYLDNCNVDGPISVTSKESGQTYTWKRGDPNFITGVLGFCDDVGRATKALYEFSDRVEFFEANQNMKRIHEAAFFEFIKEEPRLERSLWDSIVTRTYTLTPPPGYEE